MNNVHQITTSASPLVPVNSIINKLFAKVITDYIGLTCLSSFVALVLPFPTLLRIRDRQIYSFLLFSLIKGYFLGENA